MDWEYSVVIDNGSGSCKAGLSSDEEPKAIIANAPKKPIARGVIKDWDEMPIIWKEAYEKLGVQPEHQPVLLSEIPFNPVKDREKMAQV